METIIVATLVAGAVAAAKDVTAQIVKDTYAALKALIIRKCGRKGDVAPALEQMEKKPESEGRQKTLTEELVEAGAGQDAEIAKQVQTLLDLLKQYDLLGAGTSYHASLQGSGANVQGTGATGAGAGGMAIGGNARIQGDIRYGDIYYGPKPQDDGEARAIYCRVVANTCKHLSLLGLEKGTANAAADPKLLCLDNVYIALDTKTSLPADETKAGEKGRRREPAISEDRETRPLSALKAAIANPRLVLLGEPGGGKSTFVNHLAYRLASRALKPDDSQEPGGKREIDADREADGSRRNSDPAKWPDKETLPLIVILRDFASSLADSPSGKAEANHLLYFIKKELHAKNLDVAAGIIEKELEKGGVLVLLDGLDEVTSSRQPSFVRDAVAAFANRYDKSRFLITCRVLSYQPPAKMSAVFAGPDLRLPSNAFPSFELAPFDQDKIEKFITAWYNELSTKGIVPQKDTPTLAGQLQFAVTSRPDLQQMAPNPLLLTMMAMLHVHNQGRLPGGRAKLYEEAVDMLLWHWQQIKTGVEEGKEPGLRQLLTKVNRNNMDLKLKLGQLAFEAHGQTDEKKDRDGLAGIEDRKLRDALEAWNTNDLNWARDVIKVMKNQGGLLIERVPGVFTFPHRTFQEYLAGVHLSLQADFAKKADELAKQESLWRLAILLAVGRLAHVVGDVERPLPLVAALCPEGVSDDDAAWRKAWLAGDALLEIGSNRASDSYLGPGLLKRVRQRMADLLNKGRLSARERSEVGDSLGRLVDPRLEEGDPKPDPKTGPMILIPGGRFWMGAQKDKREKRNFDEEAYGDESPVHQVELSLYHISKYPVTVGQYQRFMEAGGFDEFKDKEPKKWDDQKQYPSRPVVYVSWYEACAYARWAECTLPTEAQWERAARGPDPEYQKYPWGNKELTPESANYSESKIGHVTPVGIFPEGCSPEGVLDLVGNVWEWCKDYWSDEKYYQFCDQQGVMKDPCCKDEDKEEGGRVVRGGSFINYYLLNLRCAARYRLSPNSRNFDRGFRVVRGLS